MCMITILTAAYNDLSGALRQLPYFRGASAVSLDKSRLSRVAPKLGEMALAESQRGQDDSVETFPETSPYHGVSDGASPEPVRRASPEVGEVSRSDGEVRDDKGVCGLDAYLTRR